MPRFLLRTDRGHLLPPKTARFYANAYVDGRYVCFICIRWQVIFAIEHSDPLPGMPYRPSQATIVWRRARPEFKAARFMTPVYLLYFSRS